MIQRRQPRVNTPSTEPSTSILLRGYTDWLHVWVSLHLALPSLFKEISDPSQSFK